MLVEAPIKVSDVVEAAGHLDDRGLDEAVRELMHLRARRRGDTLTPNETALLERINQGIPPDVMREYDRLSHKQRNGDVTPHERQELLQVVDRIEALNVEWLRALIDLADVRGVTLDELRQQLGVPPHAFSR